MSNTKLMSITALKALPSVISAWAINHKGTLLPVGATITSWSATVIAVRNSRRILSTIDDARDILSHENNSETRKKIYIDILKELTPLVAPILILQATSTGLIIAMKKDSDNKDKQIAELTAALGIANNAVTQYQLWQKEAKAQMSDEEREAVDKAVAKEKPPLDDSNVKTLNDIPDANKYWLYYDTNNNRKFYSKHSPKELENYCKDISYDLADGNCDGDKVTHNDIYWFLSGDNSLSVEGGDDFGWTTKDCHGQRRSDTVMIEVFPSELADHETLCYELHIGGRKLNSF